MKKVAIFGLGLIGGSIAKALRRTKQDFYISAFDYYNTLDIALNDNLIDKRITHFSDIIHYDLIFIALPIDESIKLFKEIIPHISDDTIISDVCGVKSVFENIWVEYRKRGFYFGGHPMTGKEKGGLINSDELLFENSVYIISDKYKTLNKISEFIEVVKLLGARIKFLDPYLHDKVVANVSHLPQLLSVAILNSVNKFTGNINFLDFAAGGFRDMTRIASSDFTIWEGILDQNKESIINSIDNFISEIQLFKDLVSEKSWHELSLKFENARIKRDEIPKNTKGFITPLYDIFVFVVDQPGVISKISTALYDKEINIKDIELLKIREGTGGTFRLSFESADAAEKAKEIITSMGFEIR